RHGLFATYEAFAMISASMTVQHAKWLAEGIKLEWRRPIASLNVLLTSTCWRNDHNGFSHQGPGLRETKPTKEGAAAPYPLAPLAAAWLLRTHAPEIRVRVVNVVDLMTLFPPDVHPHGIDPQAFTDLFTADRPVVFAFHGYQRAIHEIVHGRPATDRFHVRGF